MGEGTGGELTLKNKFLRMRLGSWWRVNIRFIDYSITLVSEFVILGLLNH